MLRRDQLVDFESQLMSQPLQNNPDRSRLLEKASSLSDRETGHEISAGQGRDGDLAERAPPLTNAELVQLQIRVIALENLMVALLADASDLQLSRVRDIAASIFPQAGVEHRLTVHAAGHMEHLAQRSQRLS